MNRVWAIKAEQRLSQLEARTKAAPDVSGLLADIDALKARILALESKPKPGRPPKDKTE
jgi:BMFP domain-containing protein YqiC